LIFKLIAGFHRPDSGQIDIDAALKNPRDDFPHDTGILIDRPAYISSRSGLENLLQLARINNHIDETRVREEMLSLDLDPESHVKVRRYSLGMKQKLSLAQAFMEDPQLILLDEPFNALDRASVEIVFEKIRAARQRGATVIFTSHNADDVSTLSDRSWRLENGELQQL
jgi:ABC-2 type transport system ATP-binding protein